MKKAEEEMLNIFLLEKENRLEEFSKYIGLERLNFTIEELKSIEDKSARMINDNFFAELYNIYLGEIILKNIAGEWSIGKLRKDVAYHKPIILRTDKNKMRLCPIADWFGLLEKGRLQEGISEMVKIAIEYGK